MATGPTIVRYGVLAWLVLLAALSYLCRNGVGVAESTIREDLGLTLEQSGWFMGAFFWTYACLQIPSGWFAQRFGTRVSLTIFAVVWSIAAFGIGMSSTLGLLIAAQLVMGVAQAGIFPAACNSIGHWMPFSQRSFACGILAAGMQVGAIAAGALAGALIIRLGWRYVFFVFAVPGIICGIVFVILFRDRPEQVPSVNDQELDLIRAGRETDISKKVTSIESNSNLLSTFGNPALWLLCGQQICRAGAYLFFASWFPTFLQRTRGVPVEESGYLQGLVLTGTLTGSLLGGYVTDWIWKQSGSLRLSRCGLGAAALLTCSLLFLASWFVKSPGMTVALLATGSFFAAVAGPCAYSVTIDIGGKNVPQVFGMMNMCGNIAAGACPVLIGKLFEWTSNWNLALLMFAGVYFVGAICWAFINPEFKRFDALKGEVQTTD